MNNENISELLLAEIKLLNTNIKEIIETLKLGTKQKSVKHKVPKEPPKPLTKEDIEKYQTDFANLYDLWLKDQNQKLQDILNNLTPDEARKLADANNLNVTTRMSKEKVLKLIEIRFREKKMLATNTTITKPFKDKKTIS